MSEPKSVSTKELADYLAESLHVTKREAHAAVRGMLDQMRDALVSGGYVAFRGFGRLFVRTRKARTARNPRTGETVKVPAKKRVAFKPARELRDLGGEAAKPKAKGKKPGRPKTKKG